MSTVRCASCGDYSASLLLSVSLGGAEPDETALCPGCIGPVERQALGPVGPLAPHAVLAKLMADEPSDPAFHCPDCGYDVEELARTGKLGCRRCYEVFSDEVLGLVRRAIGRDTHRGKLPPPRLESGDGDEPAA